MCGSFDGIYVLSWITWPSPPSIQTSLGPAHLSFSPSRPVKSNQPVIATASCQITTVLNFALKPVYVPGLWQILQEAPGGLAAGWKQMSRLSEPSHK